MGSITWFSIPTVNNLAETLNKGEQCDVVFLEVFDRVSHHHLFHHYGICGDVLDWVKNFTLNRFQQVIINGYKSGVSSGVPFNLHFSE